MMVGEFGLSEEKPGALDFLRETLSMYDKITSGWFYWSYDRTDWGLHNNDWEDRTKTDVLVRPYPQKIAGEQPHFQWQPEEQIFALNYCYSSENPSQTAPTEIYLPPRSFPDGWQLINHGVEIVQSFDPENHIFTIMPKEIGEVIITIQGKT